MKHHCALVQWPLIAFIFAVLVVGVSSFIETESNVSTTISPKPSTNGTNQTSNSTKDSTSGYDSDFDIWEFLQSNMYYVLAAAGALIMVVWLVCWHFNGKTADSDLENSAQDDDNSTRLADSPNSSSLEERNPRPVKRAKKGAKKADKKRNNESEVKVNRKAGAKSAATSLGATSDATSSVGSTAQSSSPIGNSKRSQAANKKGSTAPRSKRTTTSVLNTVKNNMNKMKSMVANVFSAKKEEKDGEGKKKKKAKKDKDKDKDKE